MTAKEDRDADKVSKASEEDGGEDAGIGMRRVETKFRSPRQVARRVSPLRGRNRDSHRRRYSHEVGAP